MGGFPFAMSVEEELNERCYCTDSEPGMSSREPLGSRRATVTAAVQVAEFGKAGTDLTETAEQSFDSGGSAGGLGYIVR